MEVKETPQEDTALFDAIRSGRHELLDELYVRHRAAFLTYAQRQLFATEEDAADCFQDAVIAFYKNIVSGRLTELTCGIRTYLFAVGKRMVYRRNQQRHREMPTDPDAGLGLGNDPSSELDLSLLNRFDQDHDRALLAHGIAKLGETCQQILTLFYYHHYPIESIQSTLNLSSPGATRIKKMRCLDQLKTILLPQS
ncbi:sigma-70 family RNA polymerase sigma factor [Neolewinella lacunae]|uniref:Sigma-70 family RNA polymerase sigma factor n=1 Tax=Neolewinella lacunae TaxID=1517758 RepID=A0A923PLL5_9BACT|nr:sigma-70 family RNA polymerase sigma factor [Neolewinella lacunae]MBC6995669.1 sigma-70 family RNA polymerase sigma factor [Neolewinella lacunae]MDN3634263.1 sigma-70 family RNA polymerase sigma factor [Neolewinella lacunae]